MKKIDLKNFKKTLNIQETIIGIDYPDKLPRNFYYTKDTICTALARVFKHKKSLVFNRNKYKQLCAGADYFLKLSNICNEEATNVYVKDEYIFKENIICEEFFKNLPKFPERLRDKYIYIKPFLEGEKPEVVLLLVNPSQANRILGLLNYSEYSSIKFFPNQPTCISIFAPLVTNEPHINFIDYYDRYYQGKIDGKHIWPEDKMLVSLSSNQFEKVVQNVNRSSQGSRKAKVLPQKVDNI